MLMYRCLPVAAAGSASTVGISVKVLIMAVGVFMFFKLSF
jgi:hypothetical protein